MAEQEQDEETKNRLADTNMENYGGKEHRQKQQEIAKKQKEWKNAGKKEGVEVWRIMKFRVIPQDPDTYGEFYNGDSYIVLHTYKDSEGDALLYNAHFWLGENTSQDEAGTAAIKTVELDDLLGDLPVQYRQVQNHETKGFTNLFPNMQVMEGGVDSGFRKVKPVEYRSRLLHVRGKPKKMRIDEVPLSVGSLNNNDAYVLDCGENVFQFRPTGASAWEKQASNKFVNDLKGKRHGKVKETYLIEWGDDNEHSRDFWKRMGIESGEQPESLPETSEYKEKQAREQAMFAEHVNKMFHVTNEEGNMQTKLVQEGKLDRGILKEETDDVLIIDVGRVIFVWVGKTANKEEKRSAMATANQYLVKSERPNWTPVLRVFDGREPASFWKAFGCSTVPENIC
jgi:gelsolin